MGILYSFFDNGVDLVITKELEDQKITRFVQIKTRSLDEDNIFGYTLASKDFRGDPRHVFLLYSDTTNDFIIFSMNDYLTFFDSFDSNEDSRKSHFSSASFRQENNKINNIKFNNANEHWYYKDKFINAFVNEQGLEKIETTNIEENYKHLKDNNHRLIQYFFMMFINRVF